MKLEKVVTILMWVLLAVSAVLIVSLMSNISEEDADAVMGSWININLNWTYILLGIATGFSILGALYFTFTDKDAAKKGLTALGFAAVVVGISYVIASDAIPQFFGVEKYVADGSLTNTIAKWIDTTMITTYVLLGLVIASIAVSSVVRIFK